MINIANVSVENLLSFVLEFQPGLQKLNKKIDLYEWSHLIGLLDIESKCKLYMQQNFKTNIHLYIGKLNILIISLYSYAYYTTISINITFLI